MPKCKARNCEDEGTNPVEYTLFGESRKEYYCDQHIDEIELYVKMFSHVSKVRESNLHYLGDDSN